MASNNWLDNYMSSNPMPDSISDPYGYGQWAIGMQKAGQDATYTPSTPKTLVNPVIPNQSTGQANYSYNPQNGYPGYTPSATNGPTYTGMTGYNPVGQMNLVTAPEYKGLMGQDYAALQNALTIPGQQAAATAYQKGTQNLAGLMGGRGLYGSSIMANQQVQNLDTAYQQALAANAANAAAQRYNMEAADLAKMNEYNAAETAGQRGQNSDYTKLALASNDQLNQYNTLAFQNQKDYNDKLTAWKNAQEYEKNYTYPLAALKYYNDQQQQLFNNNLALTGKADARNAADQQNLYGLLGGLGTVAGSIYGKNYDKINGAISNLWNSSSVGDGAGTLGGVTGYWD